MISKIFSEILEKLFLKTFPLYFVKEFRAYDSKPSQIPLQNTKEKFSKMTFFKTSEKIFEMVLEKFLSGKKPLN